MTAFRDNSTSVMFKIPEPPGANSVVMELDEGLKMQLAAMKTSAHIVFLSDAFSEPAQKLCLDAGAAYMFTAGSDFTSINLH